MRPVHRHKDLAGELKVGTIPYSHFLLILGSFIIGILLFRVLLLGLQHNDKTRWTQGLSPTSPDPHPRNPELTLLMLLIISTLQDMPRKPNLHTARSC